MHTSPPDVGNRDFPVRKSPRHSTDSTRNCRGHFDPKMSPARPRLRPARAHVRPPGPARGARPSSVTLWLAAPPTWRNRLAAPRERPSTRARLTEKIEAIY